jgi:stage II sporulation protein AB (anti-sigma F factor)
MIRLDIKLREDRTVIITVKDKGVGIPNIEQAREPLFTTDAAGERSGMGFTVMEGFSDDVKISSKPGRGTSVTMTRKLKGKSSS